MFHDIKFSVLRELCWTRIESLEKWLRRLIDDELRTQFGDNYIQYKDINNNFIIKKSVRESIENRRSDEPKRYPRDIDAILLDDAVNIILHPNLYKNHFREALINAFPQGPDVARTFFDRLIEPRNYLAHANPISLRQAEQIICYSNDIIDSLKIFYEQKGLEKMYNVPTIIQFTDSKGNSFFDSQISAGRNNTGRSHINLQKTGNELSPGDTLRIEIEIDPSFNSNEYEIFWTYSGNISTPLLPSGETFTLQINESHVREDFTVYCTVISNKKWHRLGDCDDSISITCRVLPPIEG